MFCGKILNKTDYHSVRNLQADDFYVYQDYKKWFNLNHSYPKDKVNHTAVSLIVLSFTG